MSIKSAQKERKSWTLTLMVFIFVGNLIVGTVYLSHYYYEQYKYEKGYKNLCVTIKNDTAVSEKKTDDKINFDTLKDLNDDIYAWIRVPNTRINYPVLQHPKDDTYYLKHNIDGEEGYPGCIYSEKCNNKTFTDPVTILYGHNMKSGTMFSDLHKFKQSGYLEENPYIYIETSDQSLVYKILTVSEFDNYHIPEKFDLQKKEGIISFVDTITDDTKKKEELKKEIDNGNPFLVLSTCTKTGSAKRLLVIAKEIEP